MMLTKMIQWFGKQCTLACDGRCDKAWGASGRPEHSFSDEPDDYVYLADDVLGTAPGPGNTVGISEGSDIKPSAMPLTDAQRMNKWCARECERSIIAESGEELRLPDMRRPTPNMPWLHPDYDATHARSEAEG